MARITVEDCLEHVDNRFQLVLVASRRARQLMIGGKEPNLPWENDKATVMALREIEEGFVTPAILDEEEVRKPMFEDQLADFSAMVEAAIGDFQSEAAAEIALDDGDIDAAPDTDGDDSDDVDSDLSDADDDDSADFDADDE